MQPKLKSPLVAAAAACVAVVAPATASARFPAVRALVTITGQSVGQQTIRDQVPPDNSACPAQDTQQRETATVSFRSTYKPVIVPLRKTGFVLKHAPQGRGGVTGGSFNYNGTYLSDDAANPDACPALASTSVTSKLTGKKFPVPSWDGQSVSPDDIFHVDYLGTAELSDIRATPGDLSVPQDEWSGDSSQLIPIHVADSLPFYDTEDRPRQQLQPLDSSVLLNWNKLQRKLRPLARGHTVTLHVSWNVSNSHKPVPFHDDCPSVGPPEGPTDFGILSCSESMTVHYAIRIRRLGPAHGCDIATAKHCLI